MFAPILTPQQRRELAAAALVPERTIRRVYRRPETARPTTIDRLFRAAKSIGVPPPPQPGTTGRVTRDAA